MKRVAVLYHHPCVDGAFAAFAAQQTLGPDALYVGHNVNVPFPLERIADCTHVYLLDYVGPEGFVEQLARSKERVTVIDHHKTAQPALEALRGRVPNVEVLFDLARSGATLALAHFAPELSPEMRQCFALVEDNDLWRHALPDTRAFSAGIRAELDLESATLLADVGRLRLEALLERGAAELAQEARRVQSELERRYAVRVGGEVEMLAVDTQVPALRSTLGNELAELSRAEGLAPAAAVCYEDAGQWKVSLRSLGAFDTTELAKRYHGGGHLNASSFVVDRSVWDSWRVK